MASSKGFRSSFREGGLFWFLLIILRLGISKGGFLLAGEIMGIFYFGFRLKIDRDYLFCDETRSWKMCM